MNIEFYPRVTRLLENKETKLEMKYLDYNWSTPSIAPRPPYYANPVYEPFYQNM